MLGDKAWLELSSPVHPKDAGRGRSSVQASASTLSSESHFSTTCSHQAATLRVPFFGTKGPSSNHENQAQAES